MRQKNVRDIKVKSLLEKRAVRISKQVKQENDLVRCEVPGDTNHTVFFCKTERKGHQRVNDYLDEHRRLWKLF